MKSVLPRRVFLALVDEVPLSLAIFLGWCGSHLAAFMQVRLAHETNFIERLDRGFKDT